MTQTWLWIGVIGQAFGAVLFGIGAHNAKNERWRILFTLNFFICFIATGLYLAMAFGQGQRIIYGRPTVWIRYITWFCSTPLLLLDLTYLGRTSLPITGSLLGANAYMIVTGLVATISPKPVSYVWYFVSCVAFIAVLYLLLNQYHLEAEQQHPGAVQSFHRLVRVHIGLWTCYPLVWLLGTTWLNVFGQGPETLLYTLLDLASKVGFGFLSLSTLRTIEQDSEVQPI